MLLPQQRRHFWEDVQVRCRQSLYSVGCPVSPDVLVLVVGTSLSHQLTKIRVLPMEELTDRQVDLHFVTP